MVALAVALTQEGRYSEAEKLYRETTDIERRVFGPEHPDTLAAMSNLANALMEEGRFAEAEKLQRQTLDIQRRVIGPEHPNTLATLENLAVIASVTRRAITKQKGCSVRRSRRQAKQTSQAHLPMPGTALPAGPPSQSAVTRHSRTCARPSTPGSWFLMRLQPTPT